MFIKYTIGVDVAQNELVCCLIGLMSNMEIKIIGRKKVANTPKGLGELYHWAIKQCKQDGLLPEFVMEATGVYHLALANYLVDHQLSASVVLPNKISNYMRTLVLKTINDDTCSESIAKYGILHPTDKWSKPDTDLMTLRTLMRERNSCIDQRTVAKNQRHAAVIAHGESSGIVRRLDEQIKLFNDQIKEIEVEADLMVKHNPTLKLKCRYITSIPGVGKITAYTVIGETLGFQLVTSTRQLVSYAGLDIRTKESGTSVHDKPRMSKRGNKQIRRCLYFPAFSAVKHNKEMTMLYERLVAKQGIRMKAAVAVQRKILVLIYTLWKKEEMFNITHALG